MDDPTRELVRGWLIKADHDLATAQLIAAAPTSYLDVAIYHCQQAAEKAMKGYLLYQGQPLQRTHDIGVLTLSARSIESRFAASISDADLLTPYATAFRYPGTAMAPSRAEFDEAQSAATRILSLVLSLLPADVHP